MIEQGTPEWKAQRLGHVTASRVADVLAKVRTGEAKVREDYRFELAVERLTNTSRDFYINDAMRWGTDTEPQARMAYEVSRGTMVEEVGFIHHPYIKYVGASPDGLIGFDGGLEIKCPNSETHLRTIYDQTIPSKYIPQVQMGMWVTGRMWWDFVSYDPRLPPELQLFVTRIKRDEEYIRNMEKEVNIFLHDVEETIQQIRSKNA